MDVKKTVKDILAREYNLKSVEEYMVFSTDLRFGEMDLLGLALLLDYELGYRFPREISGEYSVSSNMTVGDLIKKLERHIRITPVAGLYSVVKGNPVCCLTDKKCSKLSKQEVAQNKGLDDLCAQCNCVLKFNFQRLKQYTK